MLQCSGEISYEGDLVQHIESVVSQTDWSLEDVTATSIKMLISRDTTLSRLVQYCIDVAGDQYMSEEFYRRYPELLDFLASCGCDNDEILFRSWVQHHPDIFYCKTFNCHGTIIGGCPKMYCDNCGKLYFLHIDDITDTMCSRCAANEMGECGEQSRTRRYHIYTI